MTRMKDHVTINRRSFLDGVGRLAVGGLTAGRRAPRSHSPRLPCLSPPARQLPLRPPPRQRFGLAAAARRQTERPDRPRLDVD